MSDLYSILAYSLWRWESILTKEHPDMLAGCLNRQVIYAESDWITFSVYSMKDYGSSGQQHESRILDVFPAQERDALLTLGHKRSYKKDEVIFTRGDEGAWALLIEDGMVEVSVMSINGRKSILNHMEKGEILGEIALLDGQPRSAEAVAVTEVSGTILRRDAVVKALGKNNDACFSIIEILCARARNASEMFELQSLTSGNARLARCLMRAAKKWGRENADGSIHIEQNFSQSDLGELAGIARENVNRHLQAWMQEELIRFDKGDITLIEPGTLAEYAEL